MRSGMETKYLKNEKKKSFKTIQFLGLQTTTSMYTKGF